MTATRREYVFGSFVGSCLALVLLIVACATNVWVDSKLTPLQDLAGAGKSHANYGLFRGTYEKRLTQSNVVTHDISIVCDFSENVCAWSCLRDADARRSELATLLAGGPSTTCPSSTSGAASAKATAAAKPQRRRQTRNLSKEGFMNAGLYLSAVLALAVALLVTAAAALLAVLNAAYNPRFAAFAVDSLRWWNAAAAAWDLLCMILWGSLFASRLTDSIALNDVISEMYSSKDQTQLGWSYWLLLVAIIISCANVGVLVWRDYLIKREPPPPTYNPEKEEADGTIFLY